MGGGRFIFRIIEPFPAQFTVEMPHNLQSFSAQHQKPCFESFCQRWQPLTSVKDEMFFTSQLTCPEFARLLQYYSKYCTITVYNNTNAYECLKWLQLISKLLFFSESSKFTLPTLLTWNLISTTVVSILQSDMFSTLFLRFVFSWGLDQF